MNLMREQGAGSREQLALTREQLATWLALTAYLAARMQCEKTSEALTRIACSQMHAASYLLPICMQPRCQDAVRETSEASHELHAALMQPPICYLSATYRMHAPTRARPIRTHPISMPLILSSFVQLCVAQIRPLACARPACDWPLARLGSRRRRNLLRNARYIHSLRVWIESSHFKLV